MKGYLILHLHAHLPFVRHPEHERFLEEDWLFEAITETYLPLVSRFEKLADDGVPFRISMTLTPPLVQMLRDELLQRRYGAHLDRLCELAEKELDRTRHEPRLHDTARFYHHHLNHSRWLWHERYKRDLVGAFRRLQDRGVLEIVTCGATHGFLPLMQVQPETVRAQVSVAAAHYRQHFGRDPAGIWLPECGYYPGVERMLAAEGIRYFFVDTHGIVDATPRPRYGVFAPLFTPSGVAAFGRDPESSEQVWSAEKGYPGDPVYREFYRDVGYDLDYDYVKPYVQSTGERKNTGFKYHRITGKTADKDLYDWRAAFHQADVHAGNFMFNRERQIEHLALTMGDRKPVVVAPYDAELFGHWWFEGPVFLEMFLRKAAHDQSVFRLATGADYLRENPTQQVATPPLCSWGAGGYAGVWLDGSNDWIYRHLHGAAERMIRLASDYREPSEIERRALNQAARELLLAQSSDWAFIMKTGTMVEYAIRRTREHLLRFLRLEREVRDRAIDEGWLAWIEGKDNLFPELDYGIYRPGVSA
ncbi:glycoside hydrolase family 57 protein [Vulgatibacter incomptus]|uniref:Glycogen branching enzyme, GH-57-type, archaeal n=1 Tax=Vulgatibacter incomptus TaxID=1391653 RepID=A0A0K1PB48_9BACT|nr:1,4-alpha-glucan branching protein domain-containing protein [Vulgatibacter incomptus]AKU90651.1 Glycogen branching enzyme, GH-57-type, archaeal [Vulgatibacter incomptus]